MGVGLRASLIGNSVQTCDVTRDFNLLARSIKNIAYAIKKNTNFLFKYHILKAKRRTTRLRWSSNWSIFSTSVILLYEVIIYNKFRYNLKTSLPKWFPSFLFTHSYYHELNLPTLLRLIKVLQKVFSSNVSNFVVLIQRFRM